MSVRPRGGFLALTAVLLTFALRGAEASESLGAWHEDTRYGFKIRVPKDWSVIPQRVEEKWIVAKFLGDRDYSDGKQEWTVTHRANLTVIVITDAAKERRGAKVTEKEDEVEVLLNTPFKDYRDYLKRNYSGGGWYFSREETGKLAGVEVEFLEAKIEKLVDAPRRIFTWVFRHEEADFCVQVEVLENVAEKLRPFVESVLKSFQFVKRTQALPTDQTTGEKIEIVDPDKEDPAARRRKKAENHERFVDRAVAAVPAGWTVKRFPHVVVLSHVDDKYTMRIADQVKAIFGWCEETFSWMPREAVRAPLVRICKDYDEERAFRDGSADAWSFDNVEIVTHKDTSGGKQGWEFQWLNSRLLSHWLGDRDPDLATALPPWLQQGLSEYVGTAVVKGSKLDFRPDEWGRERLREAVRLGKNRTFQSLVGQAWRNDEDGESFMATTAQASFAIRWLRDGSGSKGRTKDLIRRYLLALKQVVTEIDEKEKADKDAPPEKEAETEEEEEERLRARRTKWKEAEERLRKEVFDRVFVGWTDKDWREVEASYLAYIK